MQTLASQLPGSPSDLGLLAEVAGGSQREPAPSEPYAFARELANTLHGALEDNPQATDIKEFYSSSSQPVTGVSPAQALDQAGSNHPMGSQLQMTEPFRHTAGKVSSDSQTRPPPNSLDPIDSLAIASQSRSGEAVPASGNVLPQPGNTATNAPALAQQLVTESSQSAGSRVTGRTTQDTQQLPSAPALHAKNQQGASPIRSVQQDSIALIKEANLIDRQFEKLFDNRFSREAWSSFESSPVLSSSSAFSSVERAAQDVFHSLTSSSLFTETNPTSSSSSLQTLPATVQATMQAAMQATSNQPTASLAADPSIKLLQSADSSTQTLQDGAQKFNASGADTIPREQLTTPYGSAKWHSDFVGKIRIMAQANTPIAEINLNPAELGAIEIRIQTQEDGAQVNFFTANAAAREIIDESLPRLRELLADSGINLQQGDVAERQTGGRSETEGSGQRQNEGSSDNQIANLQIGHSNTHQNSMIDYYV